MGKKLLIVGDGGHGKTCLEIAKKNYEEIAFLNDNWKVREVYGYKVIGGFHDLERFYPEYSDVVIAIEDIPYRDKLFRRAKRVGYAFPTLIGRGSYVSPHARIGIGTVIYPNAVVESDATIRQACIIFANANIGSGVQLDYCCSVYSNTVIKPQSHIYEQSRIGANCIIPFATRLGEKSDVIDGTQVELLINKE